MGFLKVAQFTQIPNEDGKPFNNSHYFSYGDYILHYRIDEAKTKKEKGKMFMIHGFGCNTTFYDELVEAYTKKGYRCVRVDLPDFGFSTRETKDVNYVPRVELLKALRDELDKAENKPSKWIVVGHSMGGSVTLDLVHDDESWISAAMLYAPMFMFNVPGPLSKVFMAKPVGAIMNTALKYVIDYDFLVKAVLLIATCGPLYMKKYDASKAADGLKVEDTGIGLCYMSARASHPDYEEMDKIKIPVLLVWGGLDLFVPFTRVKKLSESLPAHTDIERVYTGGHCLIQNRPKKCVKFGINFLKENGLY